MLIKWRKEGTKAGAMIALLKLQNRRGTEVDARGLCGHLLFECLGSRKQDENNMRRSTKERAVLLL
jgi:hypothetical protein